MVMLYDPAGSPIAMDDDSGGGRSALLRGVRLPQNGAYIVQAVGGGYGLYHIGLLRSNEQPIITPIPPQPTPTLPIGSVTPAPTPERGMLEDHVPVIGVLEAGGVARYLIRVNVGGLLTIGARAIAPSANLRLEVYDPNGDVLMSINSQESSANGDTLAPPLGMTTSGVYSVFLTDDADVGGAYVISYGEDGSHTDVLRGLALPDTPMRGNVERRGLRDVWSLYLHEGDRIAVDMEVDNPLFVAAFEVRGPDGSPFGGSTTDVRTQFSDLNAWTTGWYTIRVSGAFARTYGSYTLTWRYEQISMTPTPLPGVIPILTAEGAILAGTSPLYAFQGRAGDHVRVRVIGIDGFDPIAALLDVNGVILAESDDADGLNPVIEITLPADGTYFVQVSGYAGMGGTVRVVVEQLV